MNKLFSFWNYLDISENIDIPSIVSKWKECGSNVPMSFHFPLNSPSKERMILLLDECEKQGLKVLINDERTSFLRLDKVGVDEFKEGVLAAKRDFGSHKATMGFFLGDEPDFVHVDNFILASRIVKETMPSLTHFGNLLPYWSDKEASIKNGYSEHFFRDLLEKILKETKLKVIGFDHYTQCYDASMSREKGIQFFLYDLREYQKITAQLGIPFVVSLLSTRHWFYSEVDYDAIRWQMGAAFAHGAGGIMWFYFHQKSLDTGFGVSPFIGERLIETDVYRRILVEQNRLIDNYGDLLNDLDFQGVSYLDDANGYSVNENAVKDFSVERKKLVFLSSFKGKKDCSKYLMITNGDQKLANHFTFKIDDSQEDFWLLPGEFKIIKMPNENGRR